MNRMLSKILQHHNHSRRSSSGTSAKGEPLLGGDAEQGFLVGCQEEEHATTPCCTTAAAAGATNSHLGVCDDVQDHQSCRDLWKKQQPPRRRLSRCAILITIVSASGAVFTLTARGFHHRRNHISMSRTNGINNNKNDPLPPQPRAGPQQPYPSDHKPLTRRFDDVDLEQVVSEWNPAPALDQLSASLGSAASEAEHWMHEQSESVMGPELAHSVSNAVSSSLNQVGDWVDVTFNDNHDDLNYIGAMIEDNDDDTTTADEDEEDDNNNDDSSHDVKEPTTQHKQEGRARGEQPTQAEPPRSAKKDVLDTDGAPAQMVREG